MNSEAASKAQGIYYYYLTEGIPCEDISSLPPDLKSKVTLADTSVSEHDNAKYFHDAHHNSCSWLCGLAVNSVISSKLP